MKSAKLIFFVLPLLLTTSCQDNNKTKPFSILSPLGSPSFSLIYLKQDTVKYSVDLVAGPDPLVAAFGSKSYDSIIAPTNVGSTIYNGNQTYKLAASIVMGNNYLVSTNKSEFTMASLGTTPILAFGQTSTPGLILEYILGCYNLTNTITYLGSINEVVPLFMMDKTQVALVAEPSLSALLQSTPDLQIIDLQAEYAIFTDDIATYPQASVFVNTTIDKDRINSYLTDLASSINKVNEFPSEAAELAATLDFSLPKAVIELAIPRSHLSFVTALDVKPLLINYYNIMNLPLPLDSFYYE
jgi:NitT/TauT family transport system substrate-binding protein